MKKAQKKNKKPARQPLKLKKRWIIVLTSLGILAAIALFVTFRMRDVFAGIYVPLDTINLRDEPLVLGEDAFSMLVIGSDRYGDGRQRERYHVGYGDLVVNDAEYPDSADVIMLIVVNPTENATYVLSVPRDIRLEIVGYHVEDRLTSAYFWGGVTTLANTIQQFFNIPIDFYMKLEMVGFISLVDAIGGVSVYNDHLEFRHSGHHFPMGQLDLNGSQALEYVRMRADDPQQDAGRQRRQRDVIEALLSEVIGVSMLTHHQEILRAVEENFTTNLRFAQMISVATDYNQALGNITNLYLEGGFVENIDDENFMVIPETSRVYMSRRLRRHLELPY